MRKLLTISVVALSILIGSAVAPAETPIAPSNSCAAGFGIESAQACGSGPGEGRPWHYYDYNCSYRWEPPVTFDDQQRTFAYWCNNDYVGLHQHQ